MRNTKNRDEWAESWAESRFEQYKDSDPYPEIEPSLLNSADILSYVKATSCIYPFDEECLKGASYDVKILGEVIYWDEDGKKQSVLLEKKGDFFDLFPNSIAFVTLQPTFRIPYYLALRFNLKITHIYKGLLLGTGPLVDPGFVGKLSIPLHNLTSNTYRFSAYDELITMEFTKMSSNVLWNKKSQERSEKYKENDIKANRRVSEYIGKALQKDGLNTVISSIPAAMLESKKFVAKAENEARQTRNVVAIQSGVTIVTTCTLIMTCIGFSVNSVNKANDRYDKLIEKHNSLELEYQERLNQLESQINTLLDLVDNNKVSSSILQSSEVNNNRK